MPGHKPRTNKGLAIAAVLMCLACGVSFTQSSASHSPITDTQIPDMFVAGNTDDSQIQSGGAAAENTDAEEENTPEDVIPTETPPQIPRHLIPFQVQTLLSKSLRKLPRGCGRQLTVTGISW